MRRYSRSKKLGLERITSPMSVNNKKIASEETKKMQDTNMLIHISATYRFAQGHGARPGSAVSCASDIFSDLNPGVASSNS